MRKAGPQRDQKKKKKVLGGGGGKKLQNPNESEQEGKLEFEEFQPNPTTMEKGKKEKLTQGKWRNEGRGGVFC